MKKPDNAKGKTLKLDLAVPVNGLEDVSNQEEEMALDIVEPGGQVEKQERRKHRSKAHKGGATTDNICKWRVSEPLGGRMLNIDPILTDDET